VPAGAEPRPTTAERIAELDHRMKDVRRRHLCVPGGTGRYTGLAGADGRIPAM